MLTLEEAGSGIYGNCYLCNFSVSLKLAETKHFVKKKENFEWIHYQSFLFSLHLIFFSVKSHYRLEKQFGPGLRIGSKLGGQSPSVSG